MPRCCEVGSKSCSRCPQDAAKTPPRGSKMTPRSPQEVPKCAQDRPKRHQNKHKIQRRRLQSVCNQNDFKKKLFGVHAQVSFFSAPLTTRAPPGRPAGRPAERPAGRPLTTRAPPTTVRRPDRPQAGTVENYGPHVKSRKDSMLWHNVNMIDRI